MCFFIFQGCRLFSDKTWANFEPLYPNDSKVNEANLRGHNDGAYVSIILFIKSYQSAHVFALFAYCFIFQFSRLRFFQDKANFNPFYLNGSLVNKVKWYLSI